MVRACWLSRVQFWIRKYTRKHEHTNKIHSTDTYLTLICILTWLMQKNCFRASKFIQRKYSKMFASLKYHHNNTQLKILVVHSIRIVPVYWLIQVSCLIIIMSHDIADAEQHSSLHIDSYWFSSIEWISLFFHSYICTPNQELTPMCAKY